MQIKNDYLIKNTIQENILKYIIFTKFQQNKKQFKSINGWVLNNSVSFILQRIKILY